MYHLLRTLRWSAWLGWQIESNWTDAWLFALYMLIKPFAGSLLLVCMYWAAREATRDQVPAGFLPFLYVSNACYMLVGAVTFGTSWAVIADREHYGMLKYIRVSPVRLESYLIGRGLARGAEGAVGAVLTLAIGLLLLPELRAALSLHAIAWGWLLVYLAVGLVMLLALGLILAGAVLNMARHGMFLSEGVAGAIYLLSGAVFPVEVLPPWLRPFSLLLPTTYWLEGMRLALIGPGALESSLGAWGQARIALALTASTLGLAVVAHLFFQWCERRAGRLGKFDETSGY